MIRNFNFHQLAGPDQIAGDFDVRFARCRVAARMVVNQHNERRLHGNRHAEHLTRMHQQGVHRADGHQMMPLYPPPRVQEQYNEALAIRVEIRMRCNIAN